MTTNRALSSLEHGSGVDVTKLPELAEALECTVTHLLGLTDDPQSRRPDGPGLRTAGTDRAARVDGTARGPAVAVAAGFAVSAAGTSAVDGTGELPGRPAAGPAATACSARGWCILGSSIPERGHRFL